MTRPIRVGAQLWPGGTPDYKTWRDAVVHAEDIGTDIIFGYDHFHAPSFTEMVDAMPVLHDEQPDVTNFEGWTALASWAEITSRAQLGLLVSGMGYRNPDLLADMARTVDHISGGRLILGVGAGWYEKDYTSYGFEYGNWKTRFDNFDAGLIRIENRLKQLNPAPLREIPILIGGSGAKRTIPAIARHGHIWHSFLPVDDFRTTSALLDKQAAEAGRNGADIERSVFWVSPQSADEFVSAGATTFTTELHPDANGYDFTVLNEMLAWRNSQ